MESAASSAHLWEGRAARCLSCSRRWKWARCHSCRWHTPPRWSPDAVPSFWRTPGAEAQAHALKERLRKKRGSLLLGVINSLLYRVSVSTQSWDDALKQKHILAVDSLYWMNSWLGEAAAGLIRHDSRRLYLERVWWLFLSVQWLQRVQELSIHSEYPLVVSRYHQLSVVRRQAVELDKRRETTVYYSTDRK